MKILVFDVWKKSQLPSYSGFQFEAGNLRVEGERSIDGY